MGFLSERRRPRQISGGVIYPVAILLIILFVVEIVSPLLDWKISIALSRPDRATDVSEVRVFSADTSRDAQVQELLLESLTAVRDVMNDIQRGDTPRISARDLASAFSGIFSDIGESLASGVSGAALYLGAGLGNGTLTGLNVSASMMKKNTAIAPATGLNLVAEGLGSGLSSSILGSLNISALLGPANPEVINQAALSLAQGLGGGTASALNLTNNTSGSTSFNTTGLNGIVGNFGQGLSTSVLSNLSLSSLFANMNGGSALSGSNLLQAAGGLGSGLADGALAGLGLQQDSVASETSNASASIGPIVQTFAKGLSESFLANGTIKKVLSSVTGSSNSTSSGDSAGLSLSNLNIGKVAEGFAIGFVDGAQTSIENAGGVGAVLDMSAAEMSGMGSLPTTSTFNDGVGGAATGFGTGLGMELTKGLLQALGKPPLNGTDSSNSTGTSKAKRALVYSPTRGEYGVTLAQLKRTDQIPMTTAKLDTMMLNTTIDPIIQGGIDALGCQGVGGLAAIGLALLQNGKISISSFGNLTSSFSSLTNQTYTIKADGNTYTADIATLDITLNGNALVKAVVLIALHVIFAILTYVMAIPAIIMLNSARNLAVMTGRTQLLTKTPKWQLYIGAGVILPGALLTFIFGVVGEGQRTHFVSAHGVMGLILVLLTITAAALAPIRFKTPKLNIAHKVTICVLMLLSVAVVITAFIDISSLSICVIQFLPQAIFVLIGFLLAIPYLTALGIFVVKVGLKRWLVGREAKEIDMGSEEIEKGSGTGVANQDFMTRAGSIAGESHKSISKPVNGRRL